MAAVSSQHHICKPSHLQRRVPGEQKSQPNPHILLAHAGQPIDYDWITAQPEVESDGPNIATMILPGETEAGSAGTQSCRGITWWSYRSLENPCPRGRILSNGERPPSISG